MSLAESFQVKIVSPSRKPLVYEVSKVLSYASDGFLELHPDHGAIAYALGDGLCSLHQVQGGQLDLAMYGGIGHFHSNVLEFFTPSLEMPEDIDVERAQQALHRSRNRLKGLDQEVKGSFDSKRCHAALDRAKLRLKLKGIVVDE